MLTLWPKKISNQTVWKHNLTSFSSDVTVCMDDKSEILANSFLFSKRNLKTEISTTQPDSVTDSGFALSL